MMLMSLGLVVGFSACGGGGSTTPAGSDSPVVIGDIMVSSSNVSLVKVDDINLSIVNGDDLNVSVVITDTDGVVSVDWNLYLINTGGALIDSGSLSSTDGNYTAELDYTVLSSDGNYTFVFSAVGVVGGVDPVSEAQKSFGFEVLTANSAPVWTESSYDTGLTITDADDTAKVILDLSAVSSDADGDDITYTVENVSSSVAPLDEQKIKDSLYVDSGVLKIHNLNTNDPDSDATITITVNASATGGSNNADIVFTFDNVQ